MLFAVVLSLCPWFWAQAPKLHYQQHNNSTSSDNWIFVCPVYLHNSPPLPFLITSRRQLPSPPQWWTDNNHANSNNTPRRTRAFILAVISHTLVLSTIRSWVQHHFPGTIFSSSFSTLLLLASSGFDFPRQLSVHLCICPCQCVCLAETWATVFALSVTGFSPSSFLLSTLDANFANDDARFASSLKTVCLFENSTSSETGPRNGSHWEDVF